MMARYFNGNPEIQVQQPDNGLQTLLLMNPTTYVHYSSDQPPSAQPQPPQQQNNFVFLNSAATVLSPHAPPQHHPHHHQTQQFVGIPLSDPNSDNISALHGLIHRGHGHYNLYNNNNTTEMARETPRASQQGLSLTLSSRQQQQNPGYGSGGDDIRYSGGGVMSSGSGSGVTNGLSGMNVMMSSKYLKAAQDLLDEVVNVNNNSRISGNKSDLSRKISGGDNDDSKMIGESSAGGGDVSGCGDSGGKSAAELSTVERQEIQKKKAKLIAMLDEVEQRYRQYHHQMQILISSFEQSAGIGSAKTYTSLALKTISKQFRCLKDAINNQIRAANKNLGEEDSVGGKFEGSRLKFVDHQLRQQRALQQLGMIQHNAWRPQRGLPERSVSVLRAWLFEHFLHPYPKDSDKHMLAKQTGLTRSQVSNWFINARVRLWKPMVEEMYLEEVKEQEKNVTDDNTNKQKLENKNPITENQPKQGTTTTPSISMSTSSTSTIGGNVRNQPGFSLLGTLELEGITQGSPKKLRNADMMPSPTSNPTNDQISINARQNRDGYSFMTNHNNFIGGFGQYPIGEIGRFDENQFAPRFSSGNGVSLTLGLPHCENQTFLPNPSIQLGRRVEIDETNQEQQFSGAYDNINIQNQRRFAAQLLPDFVA